MERYVPVVFGLYSVFFFFASCFQIPYLLFVSTQSYLMFGSLLAKIFSLYSVRISWGCRENSLGEKVFEWNTNNERKEWSQWINFKMNRTEGNVWCQRSSSHSYTRKENGDKKHDLRRNNHIDGNEERHKKKLNWKLNLLPWQLYVRCSYKMHVCWICETQQQQKRDGKWREMREKLLNFLAYHQ